MLDVLAPPDHPFAFDIVSAATATENTAVARIGFDNDAILSNAQDCGTYTGGAAAFPATTDATCFYNDCDSRTPRTFGPRGVPWDRAHLHGPPIDVSYTTPIYDSLHGPMVDPDYTYTQRESAFVPMDAEMDWNAGGSRTACTADTKWPLKPSAETFAWRLRDLHYSTLSMEHGYWVLRGCARLSSRPSNRRLDFLGYHL